MERQLDELFDARHICDSEYDFCDRCYESHFTDKHTGDFCIACDGLCYSDIILPLNERKYGRDVVVCSNIWRLSAEWAERTDPKFPFAPPYHIQDMGYYLIKIKYEEEQGLFRSG